MNQYELKQLLHYDPDTGVFTWLERDVQWFKTKRACSIWNAQFPNKEAGSYVKSKSNRNVYIAIVVRRKSYLAHRLAFLYMTGEWPIDQVDHDDGDGLNNKWVNLNNVDNATNGRNCRKNVNNTSGLMGVYLYKRDDVWCSYITINYKTKYLGRYDDWFEAVCARKSAEVKFDFHTNHGRCSMDSDM